ncbi:MAG TPA: efflux RND transporter periplasmic adaptor subunit [Pirellulales bacterium]|nr:efflux RND transporter periplasmic adaptor subunit [Pirellulales bacterium]
MRTALATLSAVVASVAASVAVVRWFPPATKPPASAIAGRAYPTQITNAAALSELPQVVALGTLEPERGVIQVSGPAADQLAQLKVQEGDSVKTGDVLAVLESYKLRQAETDAAKAALLEAEKQLPIERAVGDAQVAEAEVNIKQVELRRGDIATQEDKVKTLRAQRDVARDDLRRIEGLDESIVSTQQRQKQKLLVEQAEAELQANEHALASLKETIDFEMSLAKVRLQAAKATRERMIAALQIESLKRSVSLAETKLELSLVRAPSDGRILKVVMQPGETTGQVPILRMGQVDDMYAIAEVYETDIGRVRVGQTAKITGDALIDAVSHEHYAMTGSVTSIGTMVSKNEVRSLDPTDRGDLRIIDVRVHIDPKFREAASRLVNLQVTVKIETAESSSANSASEPTAATQAKR